MSKSQIEANRKDISSGARATKKAKIHSLLFGNNPMSITEIIKQTGFKQPTVVGRCSDLATEGKAIEHQIDGETHYSYNYSFELENQLKKQKAQAKTKRVLNALIKDDEAIDFIIKKCFIDAYCSFIRGREDNEIKEDIVEIIKKAIR